MASAKIDDLCNCKICFNMFGDKDICPRMLTCGHTFCHACLQRFISDKSDCPTCHKDINFKSADDISINFLAKSLAETFNVSNKTHEVIEANEIVNQVSMNGKKPPPKEELPYHGHCEKHYLPNHFKCLNCNEYICGTCAILMHKICTQVFPVLESMNLMKEEKLRKINASNCKLAKDAAQLNTEFKALKSRHTNLKNEIKTIKKELYNKHESILNNDKLSKQLRLLKEKLDADNINDEYEKTDSKLEFLFQENFQNLFTILSKEESSNLSRKDLENCNLFVMKREKEQKKQFAKVQLLEDKIVFNKWETKVDDDNCIFVDFLDFISSRTTVINTHKFIEEHKTELHNPKLPKDRIKYSNIEVKGNGVYFDSFKTSEGSDFGLEFESLLKTFGCSSVLPEEVFLMPKSLDGEEVVITSDGGSPRAINFLLLASGIMDQDYHGTQFSVDGSVVFGGHDENEHTFPGVIEGIQDGGIYERKEVARGEVEGRYAGYRNELSLLRIRKENCSEVAMTTFGRVKRGMEVVDQIMKGDEVKKCGFLLDFHYYSGFLSEMHQKEVHLH